MMEGWKEYKFSEIAEFPPKVKLVKGEEYPFVLMDEVDAGFKYVIASFSKNYNGSGAKFENGDTLFARITPSLENGKIAQIKDIDKPAFGSTEFFVFRGKKDVSDNDFIYYLSKTDWFRQNAVNSMVGASGRQRADAKFVGKTKLFIPPLPTQRKIAKILSAYDDLIENNLKRIKLLEEMAQKTYEEWFVRMKFPGHETVVFDEENGLPEGWKKVKLGEVCTRIGDGLHGTPKYDSNGSYYFVNGNNLENGKVVIKKETKKISENEFHKIRKELNDRTIFVAINGTIGNVGLYSGEKIALGKSVCYLNIVDEVSKLYLKNVFESQDFQNYAQLFATGATIRNLGLKAIRNYKLILPAKSILMQYDDIIKPIFYSMRSFQIQNQRLKEARDILLPRLMTGIIDVENI